MESITRTFDASIEVLKGERSILARINTDGVDRLRTVIDPLGGDTRHFNKTASVLWEHGQSKERGMVPIGHGWAKVRTAERDILGKTKFSKDAFSQGLFELCEEGHLRSWSIRAECSEASPPTKAEMRARPELEQCDMIYRKWDLAEYSLVSVPGNSDCTTLMVSRGLIPAPEGFVPPEPLAEVAAAIETIARTERYIESDGSVWQIFEANGTAVIAFPDPELAEECLRGMNGVPTMNHQIAALFGEMRSLQADRHREIEEYINLYRYGRI